MANSEKIAEAANILSSLETEYGTMLESLNSSWEGSSYENFLSEANNFKAEFFSTIASQLNALAAACDSYDEYKETKTKLETAQKNYNQAIEQDDPSADAYQAQIRLYSEKLNTLKSKINSYLEKASAPLLEAESLSPNVSTTTGGSMNFGNLDMSNYPTGNSHEDQIARATLVAKYLMEKGGFTAEQAAAMVGVYIDENGCDPGTVMEAEKNGKGVSGTGGNGYGAGIASWTYEAFKNQCLADAGYPAGTAIESLTLEEQCNVIIAMSQGSCKYYYDALKRCDNIEDASATAQIITGGVGKSNNWNTHPTVDEAKAMADWYAASNDKNYGYSEYHHGMYERRLDYAEEIYQNLAN